ncbi:dihydrofolate reductase family protein [Comamonas piscis]|uniref:Dihydrofolate reductase family protein n=1 Tax=Comamonas piscis TaxID=1562974 RepID=A0A7G5EHA1_9BURK|nr:dihydrofolate reductase family protein [Comamonas piscis]QMV73376.1 dihydrofolate reductase family protein [Comamonas piscis]WSO36181.1 dihydrofolate reductase family protein [Comamonas piscis]
MRPKIICHMIGSIDGRLISNRWTPLPDSAGKNKVLEIYEESAAKLGAQGWIVGRKTMADMVRGAEHAAKTSSQATARTSHMGNRQQRNLAITIDPSGKLHYGVDHIGKEHLVTVLGSRVSEDYLAELRADGVSYLFAGDDGHDLATAMDCIGADFQTECLLLEGGGTINGAFLKADLIDEISLLVYPGIDGLAGIPSIFDYQGQDANERPASGRRLRLMSVETLEAEVVWMRYRVERQQ